MKTFIATLLMFGLFQFAFAQGTAVKQSEKKLFWFDAGLGWGGQGGAIDVGASLEIQPNRTISLRYSGVTTNDRRYDYIFLIPVADYPMGEDANAYDLSYGFLTKGKAGIMHFSAGLSYVQIRRGTGSGPEIGFDLFGGSSRPTDYKLSEQNTVGIALRAQFIPSLRWAGLGISPYLNINPKYTFGSVTIQVAIGRLRAKVW